MEEAKISILTFPQRIENNLWDNEKKINYSRLFFNALIIPRNIDPLLPDKVQVGTPAWAAAKIAVNVHILPSLDQYPHVGLLTSVFPPSAKLVNHPDAGEIFTALKARFDISNTEQAEAIKPNHFARKYLPKSYREAFNFTKPRTNRAAIDDSYHCAINKEKKQGLPFVEDNDQVSWGQVFAFCLRQPALAKKCGFIQECSVDLPDGFLAKGGWMYIDFAPESDYVFADLNIVKRYAARLPKIGSEDKRALFAAVQFPVGIDPAEVNAPKLPSVFDELLIEASIYDDGFAKIVHAQQPVSDHMLKEEADPEFPVTSDSGIRLGWDDEQLLIWMNRQLEEHPDKPGKGVRLDAPMGVFGYRVDVREQTPDPDNPNPWVSLCQVSNKNTLAVGAAKVDDPGVLRELGVEVHPAIPDGDDITNHFWLPAFFAYWMGKSLVLPDEDAIDLFRKELNDFKDKKGEKQRLVKNALYNPIGMEKVPLLYSHQYAFRTRFMDITGGGPELLDEPIYDAAAPIARQLFLRHVIPQMLRTANVLPEKDTEYFTDRQLNLRRPLLGYPSVLFTGAYDNALDLLKNDFKDALDGKRDIGIADPDVDRVEIEVAIRSLDMDTTIAKNSPSDNYAILYTTTRAFPVDSGFDAELSIPFVFVDRPVINFKNSKDFFPDKGATDLRSLGLSDDEGNIKGIKEIILPKNRDIQITMRAVCTKREGYYAAGDEEPLKGMKTRFVTRQNASNETFFFKKTGEQTQIRGIYLRRPEEKKLSADTKDVNIRKKAEPDASPTLIHRLATAIAIEVTDMPQIDKPDEKTGEKMGEIEARGMSLIGKTGQRWQFGASRVIRHTLSPDNTSLTIATQDDLVNHWLVPITLLVNRDWSWDGIKPISIDIFRRKKFAAAHDWDEEELVGDIEFKKGINIQALVKSDRNQTFLCFIDAVEPKSPEPTKPPELPKDKLFPDEILLKYRIQPNFKDQAQPLATDEPLQLNLHLPITTPPAQMPKIVSAGMAMSRYVRDKDYASTEVRQKYLWVEFEEKVINPSDAHFGRITAYAPDPLLAEWTEDWMNTATDTEPPLALDPEYIRIISPQHTDDHKGLNAMQQLIPATDSDRHFLVPLPPGLHNESPELFGFFTYEIRVGHLKGWVTAQGRFGRGLTYQGVQHPAPQLMCRPDRNDKGLNVSSMHAEAVFDGRSITAKPVRTRIWALLYARVRMADNSDNRNILLGDKLMTPRPRTVANQVAALSYDGEKADTAKSAVAEWDNTKITEMLEQYGLPTDSELSVLCVEMMPMNEQFLMHNVLSGYNEAVAKNITEPSKAIDYLRETIANSQGKTNLGPKDIQHSPNDFPDTLMPHPLTEDIGYYRMLRSSALVEVSAVCCVDC